jgi:alkylation response protein AidB-like acyl-CoA dehydrogenase
MKAYSPSSVTLLKSGATSGISDNLLDALSTAACAEEDGTRPIGRSIDLLREADLLSDDCLKNPEMIARSLMRVASVNLSVGRLLEGHINAFLLINLYGSAQMKSRVRHQIDTGAFLGVWGADGQVPVTSDAACTRLTGMKNFASGIGTVTHAVVTVNSGPQVSMALVDVTNIERAEPSAWNMHGMKATASGTYDFTDLADSSFDWIGASGDYLKEPFFVGGVWRIAALQVGAAIGLLDRAAAELRGMGRMQAEQQKARLMTVLMRAWAGVALVDRAAVASSDRKFVPEQIVSNSIAARLYTEEVGLDAIRAVEQSLGVQHFTESSETGRLARDLSVYLRQAARDAFLQRSAEFALGQSDNAWGVFE